MAYFVKTFRVVKNELSREGEKAFYPLRCKIEQRHSILFGLIKWWSTPEFEPPHLFEDDDKATKHIWKYYPDAVIIDNYSGNTCQS